MSLQQSIALRPLVGEPVFFGDIATPASNDDIFGAIGTAARERNNMINLISVANLYIAIIALTLLGFVLALYVGGRVTAFCCQLKGATMALVEAHPVSVLGTPGAIVFANSLAVSDAILASLVGYMLCILSMIYACIRGGFFLMRGIPLPRLPALLLLVGSIVCLAAFSAAGALARSALACETIRRALVRRKELVCNRLGFPTGCTRFLRGRRSAPIVAFDESLRLTLNPSVLVIRVLGDRGWLSAPTFAQVGRGIIRGIIEVHENLHFSCHAAGRFQRRCGNFIACATGVIIAQEGEL